jgi:glycosyltransferase involved in cell wall biosynthesis
VGATLEDELTMPGLLTFDASDPVRGIAAALDRVLSIPRPQRRELETKAVEAARSRWSWRHCADGLLDLATRR